MRQGTKTLNMLALGLAAALMLVSFCSYFSFNYFYLYGHIGSLGDFIFCLVQWVKLAGIAIAAGAIFLRSKRLSIVLKYIYIAVPLISLFWLNKYMSLKNNPATDIEWIYYGINNIMPKNIIKLLFILEAVLMFFCALAVALRDGYDFSEIKNLKYFFAIFLFVMPLNLLQNISARLGDRLYSILLFKSFSYLHFVVFTFLLAFTYIAYVFLKDKNSEARYKYMSMLSIVLLVQYMSRASMLTGDGYNCYYTIIAFIPLFVCTLGVITASVAIFTKNKILSDISFFVHAPGAWSVFFYFGKETMSNFGTILDFSCLYFMFMHGALFIICVLPILLKEQSFCLKRCAVPLVYYALFVFMAAAVSEAISLIVFSHGELSVGIFPNFSFTQESPIEHNLPLITLSLFGLKFNILYLSLLFLAYVAIFFAFYFIYYYSIGKRLNTPPAATFKQKTSAC